MEEFKCPICKKQYCEANPPRLLTMCGHTFCHHCLKNMIKRKDNRFQVRCPEDKISMNLDLASPSYFPKNMAILQVIIKARKLKNQTPQDNNEFLIETNDKEDNKNSSRRETLAIREHFINSRRASYEQGLCLLHQKPLDIICMEEKKYICTECALFGLHKGHRFTSIKELNIKRGEWLQDVLGLIQEKKSLQSKFISGEYQKQLSILLQKKKDVLLSEASTFYAKIRTILSQNEKKMQQQINERMEIMEKQLITNLAIDSESNQDFSQWSKNVEEKITSLQSDDIINSLSLFYEDNSDLVSKGKLILSDMNRQIMQFWSHIQTLIQYPKIQCCQQLNGILQTLITILVQNSTKNNFSLLEHDRSTQITSFPIEKDVSLLDNSQFKDDIYDQSTTKKVENQAEIINFEINSLESKVSIFPEQNKINVTNYRSLQRVRSGNISMHQSAINSNQNKFNFQSPKNLKKTQFRSRNNFLSPASGKSKLRKFIIKLKQPQKIEKMINLMEKDSLETADLSGLQMGDQIAKQFCLKVSECKKMKMLRLIKNQLTDQCARQVALTLTKISILNVAQNSLGEAFLEALVELAKKGEIKGKSVQLGQNRINARRHKDKIDELKSFGILITL